VGERTFFGPATIVEPEENIAKVRENPKIAQSRQKSYADSKRKDISFEVGGHIYLKVSPLQGTKMFHVKGKLSPRYVSPYLIVKKTGKVAYKLELSSELTGVHLVFHVSTSEVCGHREEGALPGTRRSRDPRVPRVPSLDPGLGRQVNQEHHHALLQGALE
jgi:hypothetical protein